MPVTRSSSSQHVVSRKIGKSKNSSTNNNKKKRIHSSLDNNDPASQAPLLTTTSRRRRTSGSDNSNNDRTCPNTTTTTTTSGGSATAGSSSSSSNSSSGSSSDGAVVVAGSTRVVVASTGTTITTTTAPPQPRRRSVRGCSSHGLQSLAHLLKSGKPTVFITGAGLSVNSGIRPFRDSSAASSSGASARNPKKARHRGGKNSNNKRSNNKNNNNNNNTTHTAFPSASSAIWNSVIWTTATREAFRKNPLEWYNQFWIPHFLQHDTNNTAAPQPNAGHYALHQLQQLKCTQINLITQNVDGLHIQVEDEQEAENEKEAKRKREKEAEENCSPPNKILVTTTTMMTKSFGRPRLHDDDDDDGNSDDVENANIFQQPSPPRSFNTTSSTTSTTTTSASTTTATTALASLASSSIIEAHGRIGLYKCLPDSDSDTDNDSDDDADRPVHLGHRRKSRAMHRAFVEQEQQQKKKVKNKQTTTSSNNNNNNPNTTKSSTNHRRGGRMCRYQFLDSLTADQLEPPQVRSVLKNMTSSSPSASSSSSTSLLSTPPTCPSCGRLCLPQALLFDEGYHSHCFYQFEQIEQILAQAQVVVFVGTSFSVTLTQVALGHAKETKMQVYNINPLDLLHPTSHVHNICGKAEDVLPRLLKLCREEVEGEKDTGNEAMEGGSDDSAKADITFVRDR